MSIANQITALTADKTSIENAIVAKGGMLSQNSGFGTFATDIGSIELYKTTLDALINRSITSIESDASLVGINAMSYCTSLASAKCNKATRCRANCFKSCRNLTCCIFPKVTEINESVFDGCTVLTKLVLGASSVATITNANAFNSSPFAASGTGGTVYVPANLVSSYESATNWSALNCTFKAIATAVFSGDGETKQFTLTDNNAHPDEVFYIKIGNDFPKYTYDNTTGVISFATAPISGTDNIEVYFKGAEV